MAYRYSVYGLVLDSEIECPSLNVSNTEAEVTIQYGKVEDSIGDPVKKRPLSEIKPGTLLIKAPRIAKYLVTNGNKIIVEPLEGAEIEDIRIFLLGSGLAGIIHQRGMVPFHASSVSINGINILIAGNSGSGKSTLVAEILKHGHGFISDDVSAVSLNLDNRPIVHSGFPNLRLWNRSLRMLEINKENLKKVRKGINKFNVSVEKGIIYEPSIVHKVLFLNTLNKDEGFTINKFRGLDQYQLLKEATFRKSHLKAHGQLARHFTICSQIINHCELIEISRNLNENTISSISQYIIESCYND